MTLRSALVLVALVPLFGCSGSDAASGSSNITDVKHTDVERQSIGNCWLYAEASWIESMNLSATGEPLDVSQSYWTYWHWFDQIVDEGSSAIETGGSFDVAASIVTSRGLVHEADFIAEDTTSEMSSRQHDALDAINRELKDGRLSSYDARSNRKLVREVLDDAWKLTPEVREMLTRAFGDDASATLDGGASVDGTAIVDPKALPVRYTERKTSPSEGTPKDTTLDRAIAEWRQQYYPSYGGESARRDFQIRVQKALHDAQPVVITWNVDFNAMESWDEALRGSFNMTTLGNAGGPGRQGGHMTVLEDYQAETEEFGTLAAGVTLDPSVPEDKAKLDAALLRSTKLTFIRIKNSWGAFRDDRASAPGFPGYHDLYLDYLNGPITWCPSVESKTSSNCTGKAVPWKSVVLPPGY